MKNSLTIEYCPKCHWMLRATYFAQEFLSSFENEITDLTLVPSLINGTFSIKINDHLVFDRKTYGGFPEVKELKQMVRDIVAPGKSLGHADTPSHRQ